MVAKDNELIYTSGTDLPNKVHSYQVTILPYHAIRATGPVMKKTKLKTFQWPDTISRTSLLKLSAVQWFPVG